MNIIGIDNGVSGSIAVLDQAGAVLFYRATPVTKCLNYTKTKAWINRICMESMGNILYAYRDSKCGIERPMVNPSRFRSTVSALRALEATQIALEQQKIPYEFLDSKEWQRALLPKGLHKEELKIASNQVCARLFPGVQLKRPGDGDSLLIAEFVRRESKA